MKLLELIKSSSSCTYMHIPYTRDYVVACIVEFEDAGETLVEIELDSERHSEIVKYIIDN